MAIITYKNATAHRTWSTDNGEGTRKYKTDGILCISSDEHVRFIQLYKILLAKNQSIANGSLLIEK